MDEAAVRGGELETIREFDMKSLPITFGTSPDADMRVDDADGLIAAEEARIWVQRGRLVYHKLTTLSAMASEGVTAGWQFLDDGDEIRVGPYRIIFQKRQAEAQAADAGPISDAAPQEHGMALHRVFGLTETDRSPDLQDWDTASEPAEPNQDPAAPLNSVTESGDAATQEVDKPSSSWDVDASSTAFAGGAIAEAGPVLPEHHAEQSDGQSIDTEFPGESQWTSPLLEPKSADWLVEQSQPIEGPVQIVQPDSWGGFASNDVDTGSEPSNDEQLADEEEEPQQRASGT